ncbi:MGMT family protein [Patescibacteria group bacterium]
MMVAISDFAALVYKNLKKVPRGRITTYQELAKAIGRPRASRAVGNALNKNFFAPKVPCHRVVKSNGQIGGYAGGVNQKIELLKKERIIIKGEKIVDFKKVLYKF